LFFKKTNDFGDNFENSTVKIRTKRTTGNGNVRENGKEGEKGKEKAKKQLTQEGGRGIIFKRSRKGPSREGPSGGAGILKTIQRRERNDS
jgi:hypothetical protein